MSRRNVTVLFVCFSENKLFKIKLLKTVKTITCFTNIYKKKLNSLKLKMLIILKKKRFENKIAAFTACDFNLTAL